MEQIKRFFECLVPVTSCNLRCEYCYVAQLGGNSGKITECKYSAEQMQSALTKERLGGTCYFSFCGAGETLFHPELPSLVAALLKEGHYVNITTNGTFSKGIERLLALVRPEDCCHLLLSFSLHWIELQKRGLTETFAANVKAVKQAGCSILVQFNLYDGYLPHLDEIREFCLTHFGALPQVAATRKEEGTITLHTNMPVEEYLRIGRTFESPLFEFTMRNFNRPFHKFCYAGAWSFVMNMERGTIRPCYCNGAEVDIFADPESPVPIEPVGVFCHNAYCINSSHYLSLGNIPSMYGAVTYAGLRNREHAAWFTPELQAFLSQKLYAANEQKSFVGKIGWNICEGNLILGRALQRRYAKLTSKRDSK